MVQLEQNAWIRNSFQADITEVILFAGDEAQLLNLSCYEHLKEKFSEGGSSV